MEKSKYSKDKEARLTVFFYTNEKGYRVFTEKYHLQRGTCCKNGCIHCPFGYDKKTDSFVQI